jgi:uncharacterized membrane protein SpoIIM required for sporulation
MSWAFVLGLFVALVILIVGIVVGAVIAGFIDSQNSEKDPSVSIYNG